MVMRRENGPAIVKMNSMNKRRAAALLLAACAALAQACRTAPRSDGTYAVDGRLPLSSLYARFLSLTDGGPWRLDTVYSYPGDASLKIVALRTPKAGPALWILAGIHGEEPAGPNAAARSLDRFRALADSGVPVVLLPLCNPKAYRGNWRYPNTPDRDWRKGGGYSVGDAEHLLPDLKTGDGPRAPASPGPENEALTAYALELSRTYPPELVLDFHEDELSTEGGYVYSQGAVPEGNPVASEVIGALRESRIPIRLSGKTRFGETINGGVISRGDDGLPLRDGSIDELLAATTVFADGKKRAGPSARTVIVVETPAYSGSRLERRVAAQAAVLSKLDLLWRLNPAAAPR